jgi:hypothetical protein
MAHSVQLIVGRGPALASFLRQWPVAYVVDLRGGWQAIPLDEPLYEAIEAKNPGAVRPSGLDVSPLGLCEALSAVTAKGGGLAYVETDYFGGAGGQSAMAYVDGSEAMAPQTSRGGAGPINQALRCIGVVRSEKVDEFDTVGLGERRKMADYAPDGLVRARGGATTMAAETASGLPIWKVALIIVTTIAIGVAVAVWR